MKFVTLCSFLVWEGPIDTGLCPNVLYLLILVSQTSVIFIVVLLLNILADTYCFYHREYKLLVARHLAWHQSHTYSSTLLLYHVTTKLFPEEVPHLDELCEMKICLFVVSYIYPQLESLIILYINAACQNQQIDDLNNFLHLLS